MCVSAAALLQATWRNYWDFVVAIGLLYTALVTPYEVAFLPAEATASSDLFVSNRIVDAMFIMVRQTVSRQRHRCTCSDINGFALAVWEHCPFYFVSVETGSLVYRSAYAVISVVACCLLVVKSTCVWLCGSGAGNINLLLCICSRRTFCSTALWEFTTQWP